MWSSRGFRNGPVKAIAGAVRRAELSNAVKPCRRCLSQTVRRTTLRGDTLRFDHWTGFRHAGSARASSSAASQDEAEDFVSQAEADQSKLLDSAKQKADEYNNALSDNREDMTIDEQKQRAKVLKELGPLAAAWEQYRRLKTAIIDAEALLDDPDPSMREMFELEREGLLEEFDELISVTIPRHILPPLPAASLPAMMSLTAGIGGGEASRFLEEMSKMYRRHAEKRGWRVEVLSSTEGAQAKGAGGNGFREMTIKFSPGEWSEGDAECFGELMWEKGTHRVQRVPPGATVDKLHSSTVNCSVSPIYPDTEEEPLVRPEDVKEEVMRARGAGGQHVNKTESAVRLTHVSGISVSMQDSRSQAQNRQLAWDVLRARLSEKRRADEQEHRNANRLSAIKGSNRGDKIRTYNAPQDRMTDHRIGYTANGLSDILSGEGFVSVVDAMKQDFAERRIEALLQGEEDLME